MTRPRILVLSPHAGIADGFARLLSLEGRYDVRKAASPLDGPKDWRADVVLVDGTLLRNASGTLPLAAPAFVLSGTREDAEALLPRVPSARGWLRKDATYPELERALTSVGVSPPPLLRPRARLIATVAFALAFAAGALASAWLLLN